MPLSAQSSSAQARWLCSVWIGSPASRGYFLREEAETVHASVDHHITFAARRDFLPAGNLLGRVEHWASLDGEGRVDIVRPDSVQDDEVRILGHGPELLGLRPGGHEELAALRFVQRAHRLARTKPVTIGLDRRTRRYLGAILQPAPVRLERGAVDGQAQRAVHRVRPIGASRARRDRL
jgi:hypothetical protein